MSHIEELQKLVTEMKSNAEFACVHHLDYEPQEDWASRLQSIIDRMRSESAEKSAQEPVAWRTEHDCGYMLWTDYLEACTYCDESVNPEPLYATPPAPERMVIRRIFVCIHCQGIYSDCPVTQCDCMEGSGHDFIEGEARYAMITAAKGK